MTVGCPSAFDLEQEEFEGPTADLIGPTEYIHGDADDDSIPNVDDRHPFKANADDRFYQEISLSEDVLKRAEEISQMHRDVFNDVVDAFDVEKGRVKQPVSILEKLLRKHVKDLNDLVGVTIYEPDHAAILEKVEEISGKYRVVKESDYIRDPQNDVYYAYHTIIEWNSAGHGPVNVEIQLKTEEEAKFQSRMHEAYKEGQSMNQFKSRAEELARKYGTDETGVENDPEPGDKPSPEPQDALHMGCPHELAEPLASGEPAPDVPGLDLAQGDSIVWTFPKSEGCRCGQQALDLNRLAAEHGVNVYGIAAVDREELDEMSDRLGLDSINFIPDHSHEIAERFGVESDELGRLERRIFFVRDGQIQDVTDGMDLNQPEGRCFGGFDLEQAEEKKLFDVLKHPGVYVATGKRGSGKSSLAFRVGEGFAEKKGIKPVTVGMPHGAREHFPDRWLHVEEIGDAPPQSVVIVDEAYAKFHSRESMSEENKSVGKLVNTSRHCQQTYVFVSQNASYLDKNAVSEADGLLLKEPGTFHMEFERRQFRDLSEKAKSAFDQLPANLDNREYVYVYSDEHQGMIKNTEASFYDDSISRSFSTACEL